VIGARTSYNSRASILLRTAGGGLLFAFLSFAVFGGALANKANAALRTLVDNNSIVEINTTSQEGMRFWSVDGVEQLFQQWFWFRVGNGPEASIDTLTLLNDFPSDSDGDLDTEDLNLVYGGVGFEIEVDFKLNGGSAGSGTSDVAEQISITNTGESPLDMHFFQYVDFDLGGTAGGDTAVFTNENTVQQFEGSVVLSETVETPDPNRREINDYNVTLTKLNDGVATDLLNMPTEDVPFGPGNVTWAFQWDATINPGGTFQISKDKQITIVPEPGSCVLLVAGLAGLIIRRRRAHRLR